MQAMDPSRRVSIGDEGCIPNQRFLELRTIGLEKARGQ